MKRVRWSFESFHVPMMEDDDFELYTTRKVACMALGISEESLKQIFRLHPKEFTSPRDMKHTAKEFLRENRVEFGIRRVRNDLHLLNEDDLFTVAFHAMSVKSLNFSMDFH